VRVDHLTRRARATARLLFDAILPARADERQLRNCVAPIMFISSRAANLHAAVSVGLK
jgi:hypothetical protein